MLTRQQLYELYHSGFDRMLHFVEQLLSHLGDVERHVGHRQQYTIDRLLKDNGRLLKRVERLDARLLKQEMLNYQLTRRALGAVMVSTDDGFHVEARPQHLAGDL